MELRERPFSAKLKIALFHSIITIMDGDIEAYSIRIPHISNQPADNNRNWQFLHDKDALRWRRDRHMLNFLSLRWRHKLRQFFCQYHNKSVSCSGHFDSILTVPMWYRTQQLFIQVSHHIIIIIVEVYSAPVFNSEFSTTRRATGMDESIFLFSSLSWRRMKDEVYIFNAHEKCTNVCAASGIQRYVVVAPQFSMLLIQMKSFHILFTSFFHIYCGCVWQRPAIRIER